MVEVEVKEVVVVTRRSELDTAAEQQQSGDHDSSAKARPAGNRKRWRNRMQNFFLTPVHLVRRVVFRSKRRHATANGKHAGENQDRTLLELDTTAVETAKRRGLPCYFLFLGLPASGKSTTISKIFNVTRPDSPRTPSGHFIKTYENLQVGQSLGLRVIDTPGLENNDKKNETLHALSTFLNRDLPSRIPTVTFLVARADDDKASLTNFYQILKDLRQIQYEITDFRLSNVVLLLTHSQKAEEEGRIEAVASSYQDSVCKVFESETRVHWISIENIRQKRESRNSELIRRYHTGILESLRDFGEKKNCTSLTTMVNWLAGGSKRFSVIFQENTFPIGELSRMQPEVRSMEFYEDTDRFEPYFVMFHNMKRTKKKSKKQKKQKTEKKFLVTCIYPGSEVVLADNRVIKIEDCLQGDKLRSLERTPGVVTNIKRLTLDSPVLMNEDASLGTVYCAAKRFRGNDAPATTAAAAGKSSSQKKSSKTFLYFFQNESFMVVEAAKANVPEMKLSKNEFLYALELDSGNRGTCIVNGFPCFTHVECD